MKVRHVRREIKKRIEMSEVAIVVFFVMLSLLTIYPFYNVIIVSVANTVSTAKHTPYLLPYVFDPNGYKILMEDTKFFRAISVTLLTTFAGTALNMMLSVSAAYVLSRKTLIGRELFLSLLVFTMLFSGGLVPTYLVIKDLGLINNIWVLILPTAVSTYYLIIMKNYFLSLPESLIEAARMDGANEAYILIRIALPISKPFIATFALFYAVERWNEWYNAMLYISKSSLRPLQIYLREVLVNMNNELSSMAQQMMHSSQKAYTPSIQMAAIVITTIPILFVYPFVQKHFVKGIMIGGIKE